MFGKSLFCVFHFKEVTKAGAPLRDKIAKSIKLMSRNVDNCYRAVWTNRDSTLDEYLATIAIVASYREVGTRLNETSLFTKSQ